MEESSMSSTMLMATMVAPSWMSNMMGRLATLNTLDMVDIRVCQQTGGFPDWAHHGLVAVSVS